MDWYLKVLKNYVGFRGRARRKEYWMFILVNIIFTFVRNNGENGRNDRQGTSAGRHAGKPGSGTVR